jgi:hypothetical protein
VLQSFVVPYQTNDRRTHTQYHFECGSIRLTNALMAELFHVSVPTTKDHLKGVIDQGQIDAGATIRSFRTVRTDGSRHIAREIEHDSILAGSLHGVPGHPSGLGYTVCNTVADSATSPVPGGGSPAEQILKPRGAAARPCSPATIGADSPRLSGTPPTSLRTAGGCAHPARRT